MRIAVAGKGGAGKTTLSATLARLQARRGHDVVAIDADSNPNLGVALGLMPQDAAEAAPIPGDAVSRKLHGPALAVPLSEVLERHTLVCRDDVRLAVMGGPGHATEGCLCSAHATVSALLTDLGSDQGGVAVLDLEASPEHLSRGTCRHADALLLVTEPYYRSLEATRRQALLASQIPIPNVCVVANKLRSEKDVQAVREFCERHALPVIAEIPWGEEALSADSTGIPLLDLSPGGSVVAAIEGLADALSGLTASS